MFKVVLHAVPSRQEAHGESIAGAYVVALVVCDSLVDAVTNAIAEIEGADWEVQAVESTRLVVGEDISESSVQYFDQAVLDGLVLVFNTYPPEESESEACDPIQPE